MTRPTTNILPLVSQFMADHCGITSPTEPLFVALSGGPDSVTLLHILHTLGHPLIALHCNFHLRGEESDRDQRFCEALCQQLGVTLKVRNFDTFTYMEENHLSLEMAARNLRYAWFSEELGVRSEEYSATRDVANNSSLLTPHSSLWCPSAIALGHHQDDSIETLLMNLMRGTGLNGLTGIIPRNEASHVVRPLLCLSRQQILDYLSDNGLTYITDSSNLENDTLRNQIRNQLLPLMEQILPQSRHGINLTMQHLQEVATWQSAEIQQYRQNNARRVAIDPEHTYEMISQPASHLIHPLTQYYQQQGFEVKVSKDLLLATPKPKPLPTRPIQWSIEEIPAAEATPGRDPHIAYFDASVAVAPLSFRRWQQADRIAPLGMHGHTRLLSDVFTDHHLPPHHKQLLWVVTDATGQILWVPGLIQSDYAKITSSTKNVLKVTC